MYISFSNLIKYANEDNNVKFIIISGSGGNFSSGNDLANFANERVANLGTVEQISRLKAAELGILNEAIITSRKPIFAIT